MTPVIAPSIKCDIKSDHGRVFENTPAKTRMQEVPQDVWQVIGGRVAAIVTTADLAARDVLMMGSTCKGLHQATHIPIVDRVLDRVKNENDALLKIWKKISGKLNFHGNPPPQTLVGIKAWFEDPTNADQLNAFTRLDFKNLQLKAIPPQIAKFTQLRQLYLEHNQITDISALRGLTNLTLLALNHNQIRDISALSGLTRLSMLLLAHNQIADITALTGLTQLGQLGLGNNQIKDISALRGLVLLKALYLNPNQIADITPLAGLVQLDMLFLDENQIADISPLAGLTRLNLLYLHNNQIVDISALGGLTQLNTLYLSRNPIRDITPLAELALLKWVTLDNCPLFCVYHSDVNRDLLERSELDVILEKNIAFKDYSCQSTLSRFVQFLALGNPSFEAVKKQFNTLDDSDKNLIYALVSQVSGVMTDDPNWGEHHAFDDKIVFVQAVRKAIRTKFEQLSTEVRAQVFGEVYKLAGSPQTKNSQQWGEHHAFDNVLRLIDAMKKLDRQFLAFPA